MVGSPPNREDLKQPVVENLSIVCEIQVQTKAPSQKESSFRNLGSSTDIIISMTPSSSMMFPGSNLQPKIPGLFKGADEISNIERTLAEGLDRVFTKPDE